MNTEHHAKPLNNYELGIMEHAYNGVKTLEGYTLMKITEYHAWIKTPLNDHTTSFLLAEDGEGTEYALIGNEYIPLEQIVKHKTFKP